MKVLLYSLFIAFLFVAGGFFLRQSVAPPYVSNTLQLLQFQPEETIYLSLPTESWELVSLNLPAAQEVQVAILGLFLLGLGGVLFYFFPAFVGRRRREGLSIFILNLFMGWSFLGWVIALIWAVTKDEPAFLVESPSLAARLKELKDLSKEGLLEPQEVQKLKAQLLQNFATHAPQEGRKVKRKCPHCAFQYKLSAQLIGKNAQCKKCRKSFTI